MIAPLSLDMDNKWSYLKTHGDDAWQTFPGYFDVVVPRAMEMLDRLGLTITFFIVGKDATLPHNVDALRSIADAGHEIGNHSFLHEPWLHLYDDAQISDELKRAHEAIGEATGQAPRGFRGPGFSLSTGTLETLGEMGYRYDATTFPNALNPVGRAYYFMSSNLSKEEREQRKALFGTFRDALRPNRPFTWRLEGGRTMTEIPVTTLPGLRVPIHFSYLIYLGGFSERAADLYFRFALRLCRLTRNPPSLLLHPLDFLGREDEPDLGFFPGMKMERAQKLELVERHLTMLQERFTPVPVGHYAERVPSGKVVPPAFADRRRTP